MKVKREEWMTKWSNKMKFIRQRQYADDAKRLFNWLIKGNTLMSETLLGDLFEFFNDRRKNNDTINEEAGRSTFVLRQTMNEEMKKKFNENLTDLNKMKALIRNRGNLLATGVDGLPNPIVKNERESAARSIVAIMKILINAEFCLEDWKGARTILIDKGGGKSDPENPRPITITSILYWLILCRIAESLHKVHEE
jgi:hypothetical protein